MAKKEKFYLKHHLNPIIKTTPAKHPILWDFLSRYWEKISKEYNQAKKEHGFHGLLFSTHVPRTKFNQENWDKLIKETKFKDCTQIAVSIDFPDSTFVYLQLEQKEEKHPYPIFK